MGPRAIRDALIAGAYNSVMIIVICATIGIVIGIFAMTGLGRNVSRAIVNLAGGNFVLMLVLIAISAILLGTGMNTVAAFVLVSVVAVPALTGAGVDRLNANMFVFYLALLSMITPPVCLAVFAGASIAGAEPWRTAFTAMKLGVVAYLLPFLTIVSPGLPMLGTPGEIAVDIATTAAGAFALVVGIRGCFLDRLSLPPRILWIVAGCAFLWSTAATVGAGAVLAAALVAWAVAAGRRARLALRSPGSPAE